MRKPLTQSPTKYASLINHLYNRLQLLKTDLELLGEGWTFHYAIDFAELFSLAYPLGQRRHIEPLLEENKYETFSRELVTLSFIFSKVKEKVLSRATNLILLPPYIQEMQSTLNLIRHNLLKLQVLSDMLHQVKEVAFSNVEFQESGIQQIIETYQKQEKPLSVKDQGKVVQYIMKNYKELATSIIGSSHQGNRILSAMIHDETLLPPASYFKRYYSGDKLSSLHLDYILGDQFVRDESKKWLDRIAEIPSRKNKQIPNETDAAGCAILKAINDRLTKFKALLIFISHSGTMRKVVDAISIDSHITNKVPGTRDLNFFWLYYAHKQDDREQMLNRIQRTLEIVKRFKNITDTSCKRAPAQEGSTCPVELLDEISKLMTYYDNISMSSKTDKDLLALFDTMSSDVIVEHKKNVQNGMRLLKMIQRNEMINRLIEKREELSEHIRQLQVTADHVDSLREPTKDEPGTRLT